MPVEEHLHSDGQAMLVDQTLGQRHLIYPIGHRLTAAAERTGREYLIAAWLYLHFHGRKGHDSGGELASRYQALTDTLMILLDQTGDEADASFAEMMDQWLAAEGGPAGQQAAERLALRARRSSDGGDHQSAIEQQRLAVQARERELAELDGNSPTLADERKEAAHRLSDYWGRLGGYYRKAGQISDGIDAYRHGKEIEREFRLDDSYNLTNWIVLQLLEDPARLPVLAGQIDEAIAVVQVQVAGPRRDQWWAWADCGLLCLLGRRPRDARVSYAHFQQAGPRLVDYRSVLAVLGSLREQFGPAEPELAGDLNDAIGYLESASAVT